MQLRETSPGIHKGNVTLTKMHLVNARKPWRNRLFLDLTQDMFRSDGCCCRSTRTNQRTVFLLNQEMKKPGASWPTPPPRGCGCHWGGRWRWCSVSTLIQQYQQGFALRAVVFRLGVKVPLQWGWWGGVWQKKFENHCKRHQNQNFIVIAPIVQRDLVCNS